MRRSLFRTVLVLALAATGAACDNVDESIPTTPTNPTPIVDTLTGSITVNGAETRQFTVTQSGLVTVLLKSVRRQGTEEADATTTMGLGLGTWNGSSCQVVMAKDDALQGSSVIGQVSGVGQLCVRVHDTGKLTTPLDYTVEVTHF